MSNVLAKLAAFIFVLSFLWERRRKTSPWVRELSEAPKKKWWRWFTKPTRATSGSSPWW